MIHNSSRNINEFSDHLFPRIFKKGIKGSSLNNKNDILFIKINKMFILINLKIKNTIKL